MGGMVLMDPELRTKADKTEMTDRELQLFRSLKSRALYSFIGASLASHTAVWFASKGMAPRYRLQLSCGSAIVAGIWSFKRSVDSALEKVLELDGSWSQMKVAQILLKGNLLRGRKMDAFKKYFYPEEVYNDSNPDKSVILWRHRNVYSEDIHNNKEINEATLPGKPESPQASPQMRQSTSGPVSGEMLEDPLDCMFGQGNAKDTSRSENSTPTKKQMRAHRRAHRRHRTHRDEHNNSDHDQKIRI